jgi:transposase
VPLPGYSPALNAVEYLWAWLKRHALATCPRSLADLKTTTRIKLSSGQRRRSIITACGKQAELCLNK